MRAVRNHRILRYATKKKSDCWKFDLEQLCSFIAVNIFTVNKKRDVAQEQKMLGTENSVILIDRAAQSMLKTDFSGCG
jgi:hypothetical protein